LLDRFDWGLYADTPTVVREQVRRFRTGDPPARDAAVAELVRLRAVPILRRILAQPAADRPGLFAALAAHLRRVVPPLLVADELDHAGELLALHSLSAEPAGLLDLTVFEHLRGKPEPTAVPSARLTAFRKRAAGDPAGALAADPGLPRPLADALLEDADDWATLADRPVWNANSNDGVRAFRRRRAGRPADDILDAQADQPGDGEGQVLDAATLALVLNGRAAAAADRLTRLKANPHVLADWLTARLRPADALRLVSARPPGRTPRAASDFDILSATRRGRLLTLVGNPVAAEDAFQRADNGISGLRLEGVGQLEQLLRAEAAAGRFDLVCRHLGAALNQDRESFWGRRADRRTAFEIAFGADAETAEALLQLVPPRADAARGLVTVRALLAGKADPADLAAVVKAPPPADPEPARRAAVAVAVALRMAGRGPEAADRLTKAFAALPPPAPVPGDGRLGPRSWVYRTDERTRLWIEAGDLLSELGRHQEAADVLFDGWTHFPDSGVLLDLSGRALAHVDAAAGRRRAALAHWVPLGSGYQRGRLLEELCNRGRTVAADRERHLAERAAWPGGEQVPNVWGQAARAAVLAGDFPAAVRLYARTLHGVLLNPGTYYIEGEAYLTVPQAMALAEARGLLAAGKPADALVVGRGCLDARPGAVEPAVLLVVAFDKAGRRADADALFRTAFDRWLQVVADFPNSSWARAEAAALAAGCRRELDVAEKLAAEAAALDPAAVWVRKALAEVRFRRGDRAGALELANGLAADDRASHLYKRLVERYRTAPTDGPPLDAADD
jgi:tetratricopeptide (TPR) repeat protein